VINHGDCNILPRMEPTEIAVLAQIVPISALHDRGLRTTRRFILMINLLAWVIFAVVAWPPTGSSPVQASAGDRGAIQSADEGQSLEPGAPIERELTGGQSHFYRISLTPGQYLQIAVSQRGIDVLVAL
jgi:hypothetical protein